MKFPVDWYDPDIDIDWEAMSDEDFAEFKREQRAREDALLNIDIDTLTDAEAREVLAWMQAEMSAASTWARSLEMWLDWTDHPDESTDTTAELLEAMAMTLRDEWRGTREHRDNVTKANRARAKKPAWMKAAFKQAYANLLAEKGKPPGWSLLLGEAIRVARKDKVATDDLEKLTEHQSKSFLAWCRKQPG